jgi:autotransporter family porin
MLGPLADNGGPTPTHALLSGSPAIDRIPVEDCVDADGLPVTEDQRGEPRPAGDGCDVGAFEVQP